MEEKPEILKIKDVGVKFCEENCAAYRKGCKAMVNDDHPVGEAPCSFPDISKRFFAFRPSPKHKKR